MNWARAYFGVLIVTFGMPTTRTETCLVVIARGTSSRHGPKGQNRE